MAQFDYLCVSVQAGAEKVAETVADHFPPVNTESINITREDMAYPETIGLRAPTEQDYGGTHYEGDIEGAVRAGSTAPFLTSAFGAPDNAPAVRTYAPNSTYSVGDLVIPSTGSGTIYVVTAVSGTGNVGSITEPTWGAGPHTVTNGANSVTFTSTTQTYAAGTHGTVVDHLWNPVASGKAPVPLTIWTVNMDPTLSNPPEPAIVDKYIGSYVNELGLSVESNGYLTFAASVVALLNDDTASAPALTRDVSLKIGFSSISAQISVAGAALAPLALENFSFNYNNNFETGIYRLGSAEPFTFRPGSIESTSEFRPVEGIASHYRRAMRKTSPEFVWLKLLAVGAPIAGSGTATLKQELEINIYRLQYLEGPVDISAEDPLTGVDVSANAVISPTNQLCTVRMRNADPGTTYAP